MSGLLDSLSSASRSLAAARLGLDVAGQNLANVNTPGYTRRTLVLAEEAPTDSLSAGHGVTVVAIQAQRDGFLDARVRTARQAGAYHDAIVGGLTEVEAAVGEPGASLDAHLTALFDAFSSLSDDPTLATARESVVIQGNNLATAFRELSDRFDVARRNADLAVASGVDEINHLAAEVATLNEQILAGGSDVEALRDRRELALGRLSELAGVNVSTRPDGAVDVAIGQGHPLVVGNEAFAVQAQTVGPEGYTHLITGDFDITTEVTSGRLGGLLNLRDTVVPRYQATLDQLAYDVATAVNAVHTAGFTAGGAPAGAFFVPLSGPAGAARSLAIDASVQADSSLVAASATGAAADNGIARAIAALRGQKVAGGGAATPTGAWGQLAYRVGADVASARASSVAHGSILQQVQRLRDQSSGVSMDEEAASLMRFQRSYEANARYFTTISDTLDTLMKLVR